MRCRDEQGQSAVLLLVTAAVMSVVLLAALVEFGATVHDRSRAQTGADAAALASLDGGRAAALEFATRHGATIVSWSRGPGANEVTVVVRVGDTTATARASNAP